MNFKRLLIFVSMLLLLPFGLKVRGQDFGQGQSLFADIKADGICGFQRQHDAIFTAAGGWAQTRLPGAEPDPTCL